MLNNRLYTALLVTPLVLQCRRPLAGTPLSSVTAQTSPVPAASGSADSLQHGTASVQPFIELHTYSQIPNQCVLNQDCPDPDVCHRGGCNGGQCMGSPRNAVPCNAVQANGASSPGTCFAGQCVSEERWAEVCGRVMGHQQGRFVSLSNRTYELGHCPNSFLTDGCAEKARDAVREITRNNAKRLLKCLQYPHLTPPEGYLFNWDGNDFGDFKGKGARQP